MNPRSLILMALAGVGVLLVVMLTRSYLGGLERQSRQATPVAKEVSSSKILVAARTLPVGTVVGKDDVKWQPWPKEGLADTYYTAPKDTIQGIERQVVRSPISAGEPVTRAALVAQGEKGFMAAILTPGMRAVTIKLSPTSSVGGFIFPGDRVDVILTQSLNRDDTKIPYVVSETVFQNVRVLGVDQRSAAAGDKVTVPKTATLEVTPKMAEKVAMLDNLGSLSLSLRSLAAGNDGLASDPDSPPVSVTLSHTSAPEVTQFRIEPDKEEAKTGTVTVVRGSQANVVKPGTGKQGDSK